MMEEEFRSPMNARTMLPLFSAALAVALTFTNVGAGPWLPRPGEHYTEFRGAFARQTSFYDADGTKRPLGFQSFYEDRSISSYNELGWKTWLSFAFEVPVLSRTVESQQLRASLTQTGIADLFLGLRMKLKDGATAVAAEANWIAPGGYDRDAIPRLGFGKQQVGGSLLFGAPLLSKGFLQASGTFLRRLGNDAVNEVEPHADLAVWIGNSVLVSGRYRGVFSLGDSAGFNRQSAGPEVTYRIDDRMDVFAGSEHTFAGKNTDQFNRYYVGIALKQTHLNRLQGYLGGKRRP
jgi:hypothetical protein